MTGPRVWLDSGDGWQELHGIRDIRLDPEYDPPDWIEGYGLGEMRGVLSWLTRLPTAEERALDILRPHLAACPLYTRNG
ncbi:hypothetical protein [Streptomyces sp. NPDC001658]